MFISLKEFNLNNFNTNNVTNMESMFSGCSSLKKLNLNNFNINNVTYMFGMFNECSNEIKMKIKTQYKNIKEEAFKNIEFPEIKIKLIPFNHVKKNS